MSSMSRAKLCN